MNIMLSFVSLDKSCEQLNDTPITNVTIFVTNSTKKKSSFVNRTKFMNNLTT